MAGEIIREQLDEALAAQKDDPPHRRLGDIMVSLGFVTVPKMADSLGWHLRLDHIVLSELDEGELDSSMLELFYEQTLRKHCVLPLMIEENRLILAMVEPSDLLALENLQIIAKMPIKPVVAIKEDPEGALSHLFGDKKLRPTF